MTLLGGVFLIALLSQIIAVGAPWISARFLTGTPMRSIPERSGISAAILGTLWLSVLTTITSVPVGVGAAIYLHEFAPRNRLTRFIHLNIVNLAGVPSIVYGILGLAIFVRWLQFDRSVLSGALTLSLLVLPVIIIAAREALAAVPDSIRQAAFALGATRWQMVWSHVLPAALPGIMTGLILALSRAIGETAPLILIGALTYVPFAPTSVYDKFTALPLQIHFWAEQPQEIFHELAAATIMVLLAILLTMNALAIGIRTWHQRTRPW
jgi:phosphate transport system permease protein